MSSRMIDRIRNITREGGGQEAQETSSQEFREIKRTVHAELIEGLDFAKVRKMEPDALKAQLHTSISSLLSGRALPLNKAEQDRLVEELINEVIGFGVLEPLLQDPTISDILINGYDTIFVERAGKLEKVDLTFEDNDQLLHLIDRIVGAVGRRVDESNPMVDARLPDGSRVNAIIPPLALDGPVVSIRRFSADPITAQNLVDFGAVPKPILSLLQACVRCKLNTIVSGGTGAGKTTLLNVLSSFIPSKERIITVEDAAELQLQQPHVVRLETRPANVEGKGEITARDLVKNALRMRPDRIILGEIRGTEAIDMLQAMNTGHEGSIGTIHANTPRDALARLETMVGMAMPNLTDRTIREMISRALDLVIQLDRLPDGSRRIMRVTEVTGMEGNTLTTQDLFIFEQSTIDKEGKVHGCFRATGVRPRFAAKLKAHGIELPAQLFSYSHKV